MTTKAEQPPITQADRDAATALYNLVQSNQDRYQDWEQAFARHRTTSLAADTIATLRKQLENAREALRGAAYAIKQGNLYETMCCSGQDCGCRGSSYADLALHDINEALKGQPC